MRSYLCAFLFLVLPIISICDVCFFGRTHLWFPEICETLITQHDIFLDTGGADKRFDTGGADKWTDRKIRYILQRWEGPSSAPAHTRRGAMQSSSSTMTCATALWTVMGATARSCWPSTQLWRSQMLLKPTFSVFLFNLNLWFFCEYIYNIGNTSNFK